MSAEKQKPRSSQVRPLGELMEIFTFFEVPPNKQTELTRRIGALIPNQLPISVLRQVIEGCSPNRQTDWEAVSLVLAEVAKRINSGKPPFARKL